MHQCLSTNLKTNHRCKQKVEGSEFYCNEHKEYGRIHIPLLA